MHIQKTSSWIGDLLLRWGCKDIDKDYNIDPLQSIVLYDRVRYNLTNWKCDFEILGTKYLHFGHHVPYDAEFWPHAGVTMFRNPIDRIISAFLFADGMMIPRGFPDYSAEPELRKNITSSKYPIYTYATTPGIPQCQTKMIMGYDCGNDVPLFNPKQLKEIHRRLLEEFIFFGLQEEPKATYELFIAMFGIGHLNDTHIIERKLPPPYLHTYRENIYVSNQQKINLKRTLRELNWHDPSDEFMYEIAKKIFYKRCKEYHVSTKYNS